jgi:hypothetical protein
MQTMTVPTLRLAVLCLALSVASLLAAGCETGHTNKDHAPWQRTADLTTTGKPQPTAANANAEANKGRPPVPGSPTASAADGTQPFNDDEARIPEGQEEGAPIAASVQPKDQFEHQ